MAKPKITDYDPTAANNTDVGGVPIAPGSAISSGDDAIRELMSHLAETNAGTYPVADTWSFADPADLTKIARLDCGSITNSNTRVLTVPDSNITIAGINFAQTWSATQSIPDANFRVIGSSDATKQIHFEVDGNTTSTDREIVFPDADTTFDFGDYTPTLVNGTNVSSSTAFPCSYTRIGDKVTVFGLASITPTAASSTVTTLGVPLPIASNLANTQDLAGVSNSAVSGQNGLTEADTANDRAQLRFQAQSTSAVVHYFSFCYTVI